MYLCNNSVLRVISKPCKTIFSSTPMIDNIKDVFVPRGINFVTKSSLKVYIKYMHNMWKSMPSEVTYLIGFLIWPIWVKNQGNQRSHFWLFVSLNLSLKKYFTYLCNNSVLRVISKPCKTIFSSTPMIYNIKDVFVPRGIKHDLVTKLSLKVYVKYLHNIWKLYQLICSNKLVLCSQPHSRR